MTQASCIKLGLEDFRRCGGASLSPDVTVLGVPAGFRAKLATGQQADAGEYQVVMGNTLGTVTSRIAILPPAQGVDAGGPYYTFTTLASLPGENKASQVFDRRNGIDRILRD